MSSRVKLGKHTVFKTTYGREVPSFLEALYDDVALIESVPVQFAFPDKPFVVEIGWIREINDIPEQYVELAMFPFAADSEGFDLLVDLTKNDLPILMEQFGDIDLIGVTLAELLRAKRTRLG